MIKKLVEKVYYSIWFRPVVLAIWSILIYIVRIRKTIQSNMLSYLNILLFLFLIYTIYLWKNKRKNQEFTVYFILITIFIINKMYDVEILYSSFNIDFNTICNIVVGYGVIRIFGPSVVKFAKKSAQRLVEVLRGKREEHKEHNTAIGSEIERQIKEKQYQEQNNSEMLQGIVFTDNEQPSVNTNADRRMISDSVEKQRATGTEKRSRFWFAIIFVLSMALPVACFIGVLRVFPGIAKDILKQPEINNNILYVLNIIVASITFVTLVIIIWIAFFGVLVEIAITMIKICNELKESFSNRTLQPINYLIFSISILIVSVYMYKNFPISSDSSYDVLTSGQIIILPLVIAILIPIFSIIVEQLNRGKLNSWIKTEEAKALAQEIMKISVGILHSLLNFIRFITCDFLESIQSITKDSDEENESSRSEKIKILLASAALSTAIISWLATANGLRTYVFDHYWQAAIISASIQGTLFALSTRGIYLLKSANVRRAGKVALIVLWSIVLITSSTFSYAYISRTAYIERELQNDAEQILGQYCLGKNYELLDVCDNALELYSKDINSYVSLLGSGENGVNFAQGDIENLTGFCDSLEKIQNNYKDSEISYIFDSQDIQQQIESIKEGKFSDNDINTFQDTVAAKIVEVEEQINGNKTLREEKAEEVAILDERLRTFTSIYSPEYQSTFEDREAASVVYEKFNTMVTGLNNYKGILESCVRNVDAILDGTENTIHSSSLELIVDMNKEILQTDEMINRAQEIYEELIHGNVSANDPRIEGYSNFKIAMQNYDQVMQIKAMLDEEVNELNNYDWSLLTETGDIKKSIGNNLNMADTLDTTEKSGSESEIDNAEVVKTYWRQRLGILQNMLKTLPDGLTDSQGEKLIKADEIKEISGYARLYLTDLNDFERAWALLTGRHEYKTLLLFSVIFAFGLDLFSTATGVFLYFFGKSK